MNITFPHFGGRFTQLTVEHDPAGPPMTHLPEQLTGSYPGSYKWNLALENSEPSEAGNINEKALYSIVRGVVSGHDVEAKLSSQPGRTDTKFSMHEFWGKQFGHGGTGFSPSELTTSGDPDAVRQADEQIKQALTEQGVKFQYEA